MQKSKTRYKQQNSSALDFAETELPKMFDRKDSVVFKEAYKAYRNFCINEGIKEAFSKKDFRAALESEGYIIKNSSKHANQVRIFKSEIESLN
jgi:putative DNA primase/helicase